MSAKYLHSDLKVAVIGCGNWGKNHVRVFHALGALYTICDKDPTLAQKMADQYSVSAATLDEILISKQVDACVLATPAYTHFEIAKRCLAAGKHVFIEKPITMESYQAEYLYQTAQHANKVLMVGHLLHYHTAFQKLKTLAHEQVLGNIFHVITNRTSFGKLSTESSVLWDLAPHDVSIILALYGEMPYQVLASTASHLSDHDDDYTLIDLWFSGSKRAKVMCSWIHPIKEQRITVIGDKYMGVFDDVLPWEDKLRLYNQLNTLPASAEPIALPLSEPLKLECQHFLDCISNNQTPITDGMEALNVTLVLEAALESSKSGRPISLNNESISLMRKTCLTK